MALYHELKRRNVFRVAIAYLALAWILIEVADTLFPAFGIPDWGIRFLVIVFALGFVPTLIVSWVYELTPEGIKREKDVVRETSITHRTAKRLDGFTIGLIGLALVFILVDRLWLKPGVEEQAASAPKSLEEPAQVTIDGEQHSIAVLPFVNMSDDAANEYFSDGISEELLNMLTGIPELRVIARTSSFAYKERDARIADIARELKVSHVLEGSVRKAGDRVRITVQLIRGEDSSHLWSRTFDRTLSDIFAIQEEIASAIIAQLKLTLLGEIPSVEETSPEAYSLYLQAREVGHQWTAAGYIHSNELYEQSLAIAPDFASAWAGLAGNHYRAGYFGWVQYLEAYELTRESIRETLANDPGHALAQALLGGTDYYQHGDAIAASRHLERALQLEPTNPDILTIAALLLADFGRVDQSIAVWEYLTARDPTNPRMHFNLGESYRHAGRLDEAIDSFRTTQALSPSFVSSHYRTGIILLWKGETGAALEEMRREPSEAYRLFGLTMAQHAAGHQVESDATLAELIDKYELRSAYNIAYVLAFRGETDKAFEWLAKAVKLRDSGVSAIAIERLFTNIQKDPRWLPFLESIEMSPAQLDAVDFKVTLPVQGAGP